MGFTLRSLLCSVVEAYEIYDGIQTTGAKGPAENSEN